MKEFRMSWEKSITALVPRVTNEHRSLSRDADETDGTSTDYLHWSMLQNLPMKTFLKHELEQEERKLLKMFSGNSFLLQLAVI